MLNYRMNLSKMIVPVMFCCGLISGTIAYLVLFNFGDSFGAIDSAFIINYPILFGIGLGSLTQIFAVVCIDLLIILNLNSLYVSTTWLLMGLSTGILIALYYINGIVILLGFMLPHLIIALLPFIIVYFVGINAMSLLVFDGIKNIVLFVFIFAIDKLNLFV